MESITAFFAVGQILVFLGLIIYFITLAARH